MTRTRLPLVSVVFAIAVVSAKVASAQDTAVYVLVGDLCARPCDTVRIPVRVMNLARTMAGYDIQFVLDRPGLLSFSPPKLVDAQGTDTQNWDFTHGNTFGGLDIKAVGLADDIQIPGSPAGLPPQVTTYLLVYLVGQVPCNPDTFSGNVVRLTPTLEQYFSDGAGMLLEPVSVSNGQVTIITGALGDINGSGNFDVIDVVGMINCAFRGNCPTCIDTLADLDCDHDIDIIDVIFLVNYVFRGGPAPACS